MELGVRRRRSTPPTVFGAQPASVANCACVSPRALRSASSRVRPVVVCVLPWEMVTAEVSVGSLALVDRLVSTLVSTPSTPLAHELSIAQSIGRVPVRRPRTVDVITGDAQGRRLEGLVWTPGPDLRPLPGDAFLEFIDLHHQSAEMIADFARRYGVMRVCDHLLPSSHGNCLPLPHPGLSGSFVDPIWVWRGYSRAFVAALKMKREFDRAGSDRPRTTNLQWAHLVRVDSAEREGFATVGAHPERQSRVEQELRWSVLVTRLAIREAGADPWLTWRPRGPTLRLGFDYPSTAHPIHGEWVGSIYPALAERLVAQLTGSPEASGVLHDCEDCGRPFFSSTQRGHLCQGCKLTHRRTTRRESNRRARANRAAGTRTD